MHPATFFRFRFACFFAMAASLAVFFALTGCQPSGSPVTGQVFLVMPEGDSLRLGSVQLEIYEERAIRKHLADREQYLKRQRGDLGENLVLLQEKTVQAAAARAVAVAAYREREAAIRVELTAYVGDLEKRRGGIESKIESNVAFIDSVDRLPPPPEGIPARDEFEEYDARRRKWLAMDRTERAAWGTVLASMNEELKVEIERMGIEREQKLYAMGDELEALEEVIVLREAELKSLSAEVARIQGVLAAPPNYTEVLSGLPTPVKRGRTDADGEFAFSLSKGRSYVLFADAIRSFGGDEKAFQWLIELPVTGSEGTRILLSNHNLVTSDAPENVILRPLLEEEAGT